MTKSEALFIIKSLTYDFKTHGLIHSQMMTYEQKDLPVLRECQKEIPELHIYELENKFRLITKI